MKNLNWEIIENKLVENKSVVDIRHERGKLVGKVVEITPFNEIWIDGDEEAILEKQIDGWITVRFKDGREFIVENIKIRK